MRDSRDRDQLPPPERREWLLDRLADLVAKVGVEPLVSWPLIEPDTRFFPDPWRPKSDASIVRLLRRLLWYAGLDELDVALSVVDEPDRAQNHRYLAPPAGKETVAWYAGIDDNRCFFGVYRARLTSGDAFVAAMAHEVAHVYRHVNALEVPNRDAEEELTDLTTVFLGTGVLSTNAAYRYRSGATAGGLTEGHQWQHQRLGYLGFESLAFLLAARGVVAGWDKRERQRVAAMLEATQRESFLAALRYFDVQEEPLADRLGLPPRSKWPPVESADDLVAFDGVVIEDDPPPSASTNEPVSETSDTTIARELVSPSIAGGVTAALCAGLVVALESPWRAALFVLPPLVWSVARGWPVYRCANGDCRARVTIASRCPKCGTLALSDDHPWAEAKRQPRVEPQDA
ncbi:MAG: hypothetical protein JNK05_38155 [Myxococcales bacterium]|nr:hypothetical protein [Myxococcales bacterium]